MNTETMQIRRRKRQTSSFITLVVVLIVLIVGSFFLLRPVMKNQNSPIAVTQRFIGYVELKQFDDARELMTPSFQDVNGWHGILFSLYSSLDPAEAGYQVIKEQNGIAQVQFSNESGGYLFLKQVNGQWRVASPSEVPASMSGQTTTSTDSTTANGQ
ncbi:hypothetical protein AAC03nite_16480 [Alicyclobacillus acidoterrestris]|uniref:hypothetical protein n=1 Tax=Alicyclobacillus suci TaxID=2816080 RepID=UPI0011963CA7|nr:hypothetical protein [Alicyclobacillus suci]GEO25863.1 hypothetical protein AAC03nite_16480 [Alicyclobacillus acidoterrestris]